MGSTTTRLALPYPVPSDSNNVPADMQRLAETLDGMVASYSQGTIAARPGAAVHGRLYYATDGGGVYYDTGAAWVQLNLNSASVAQAKGDLLIGTGPGGISRLPAGSDGQILQALAGATLGVRWTNVLGLPLGLTGAGASTRFVGGTVTGAPTTGTFAKGDYAIAQDGKVWICTAGGSPGTWISPSSSGGGKPGQSTNPTVAIKLTSPITLPTGSNVYATSGWTTVGDNDGMGNPASSDPTRSYVEINTSGRYLCLLHGSVSGIPAGGSAFVSAKLLLNTANADSNSIGADSDNGTGGENNLDVWCERNFDVGDRIYWSFWSNAPGNAGRILPTSYGDTQTKLVVRYVGPQL